MAVLTTAHCLVTIFCQSNEERDGKREPLSVEPHQRRRRLCCILDGAWTGGIFKHYLGIVAIGH